MNGNDCLINATDRQHEM